MISFIVPHDTNYDSNSKEYIRILLDSIHSQNIPNYEVILVGDYAVDHPNVVCEKFDESIKPGWITRKCNLGVELAKYETIAFVRDYMRLWPNWWKGFEKFGWDWDVCMTPILNTDNRRYRDWCVFDSECSPFGGEWTMVEPFCPTGRLIKGKPFIPAYTWSHIPSMYISGQYYVAKRQFMKENTYNENLVLCQAEDVDWFQRVRHKIRYKLNPYSICKLQKEKHICLPYQHEHFATYEYVTHKYFEEFPCGNAGDVLN